MSKAFVCDAIRTPIGRYGGALSGVRPDDLAAHTIRTLMERNPGTDWDALDDVFLGCANQAGEDNRDVARMAGLLSGLSHTVPGVTLNRLCGSGMDAVGTAARAISSGEMNFAIAGGVESMSRAPFVMGKAETAFDRRHELYDTTLGWRFINPLMESAFRTDSMVQTGDNVASDYGVSREDQDAFALRSQQRALAAQTRGFFAEETVAITVTGRKTETVVDKDEHPRSDTSLEALMRLKPLHLGGTVTAGNAAGINDGAAALILASEKAVKQFGLIPRARVLGMTTSGVLPRVMGIGPVSATQKLLSMTKLKINNFQVIELNEAFASQSLAVLRLLGLPDDAAHVNPNGGAIALGHPLGMSGVRLVLTAVHQMVHNGGKLGLCTMCVGVGQGIAIALELV